MDPISAVGIASSVVAFIGLSWKVGKGAHEIYTTSTGATAGNEHVSKLLEDLRLATNQLDASSRVNGVGTQDQDLSKLVEQCRSHSKELAALLESLKVPERSKRKSLVISLKAARKQTDVDRMMKKVEDYREQICLRLLQITCTKTSSLHEQLDNLYKDGLKLSDATAKQFQELRKNLAQESEDLKSRDFRLEDRLSRLTDCLDPVIDHAKKLSRENSVLKRLYFDQIRGREEAIETAEMNTFRWVIDQEMKEPADIQSDESSWETKYWREDQERETVQRQQKAKSFMTFLREDHGTFFFCGKAGSGKSTLMKFLSHGDGHEAVRRELETWAGGKRLVFVKVYFWIAGHPLQRSLEGLQRTLLFEILHQCPELITTVIPDISADVNLEMTIRKSFSPKQLDRAMKNLTAETSYSDLRFCLFVDGLDEYEGTTSSSKNQHLDLAHKLKSWSCSEDVKFICSGRPLHEFESTFDDLDRRIDLQDLTRLDIQQIVKGRFKEEEQSHAEIYSGRDIRTIMMNICQHSEGVILWAVFTTRNVLDDMKHHFPLAALTESISSYPPQLEGLYASMLAKVEPTHREASQLVLELTVHDPWYNLTGKKMDSLEYGWIHELLQDCDFPYTAPMVPYTEQEAIKERQRVRLQIKRLTRGILEVKKQVGTEDTVNECVVFIHRSAKEFICAYSYPAGWPRQILKAPSLETYLQLRLRFLKAVRLRNSTTVFNMFILSEQDENSPSMNYRMIENCGELLAERADWFSEMYDRHPYSHRLPGGYYDHEVRLAGQEQQSTGHRRSPYSHIDLAFFTRQHTYIAQKFRQNGFEFDADLISRWLLGYSTQYTSSHEIGDILFELSAGYSTMVSVFSWKDVSLRLCPPVPFFLVFFRILATRIALSMDGGLLSSFKDSSLLHLKRLLGKGFREDILILCFFNEEIGHRIIFPWGNEPGLIFAQEPLEKNLFRIGLSQLVRISKHEDSQILEDLLTKTPTSVMGHLKGTLLAALSSKVMQSSWDQYRQHTDDELWSRRWSVWRVVSGEHELNGPISFRVP